MVVNNVAEAAGREPCLPFSVPWEALALLRAQARDQEEFQAALAGLTPALIAELVEEYRVVARYVKRVMGAAL